MSIQQFCFKKGLCKFNLYLDYTKRYCGLQVGGGGGGGRRGEGGRGGSSSTDQKRLSDWLARGTNRLYSEKNIVM